MWKAIVKEVVAAHPLDLGPLRCRSPATSWRSSAAASTRLQTDAEKRQRYLWDRQFHSARVLGNTELPHVNGRDDPVSLPDEAKIHKVPVGGPRER